MKAPRQEPRTTGKVDSVRKAPDRAHPGPPWGEPTHSMIPLEKGLNHEGREEHEELAETDAW